MAESEYLFGWLSDEDRRDIRGLINPEAEGIGPIEKPLSLIHVRGLLDDPRNISVIAASMTDTFWEFMNRVRKSDPTLPMQKIMKDFLTIESYKVTEVALGVS